MKKYYTFRKLRTQKRLDITFLARQFGVSETEIRQIEADSSDISDELLENYLEFFDIAYDSLYFGKEPPNLVSPEPKETAKMGAGGKALNLLDSELHYKTSSVFLQFLGILTDRLLFWINLARLQVFIFFIVHQIYQLLSAFLLKSSKNRPRFALAYLFVISRKLEAHKLPKFIYLFLMIFPTFLGFFAFHELPVNPYGYFYSWPVNLAGALIVFSLWKKIKQNYLTNQKVYFEVVEKFFPSFLKFFSPLLLSVLVILALNFPNSTPYLFTNWFIMIPLLLNTAFTALLLFLFFLPIVDFKYPITQSVDSLLPLSALLSSSFYILLSFFFDFLYGKVENYGIFYLNSLTFLCSVWLFCGLVTFRVHLSKKVVSQEKSKTVQYASMISFSLFSLLTLEYLHQGKILFKSDQTYALFPLFFIILFFAGLFMIIKLQQRLAIKIND
ncbi:MAG: helix-turn-helix domain-containing protein [Streptococcaceae bacterium]|jgi:transcriptional regulator with XRE-family HTH domain|nr:helix-turn-helix domain-containing protein [Streptococcaceae bacterium]